MRCQDQHSVVQFGSFGDEEDEGDEVVEIARSPSCLRTTVEDINQRRGLFLA